MPMIFAFDQYASHGEIILDKNLLFSSGSVSESGLCVKDDPIPLCCGVRVEAKMAMFGFGWTADRVMEFQVKLVGIHTYRGEGRSAEINSRTKYRSLSKNAPSSIF